MLKKKSARKKSFYNRRKHWYHLSTTLNRKQVHLIPWGEDDGFNRGGYEPDGNRICVAPTIEQCITAIPYILNTRFVIYKTKNRVKADKPYDVFDSNVTKEGWLHNPTTFVKVGSLTFSDVEKGLDVDRVIDEAASSAEPRLSGKVLKWWKKAKVRRFIKRD